MFGSDRIIALDIGASKLVVAEFSVTKAGALELVDYGIGQLGIEPESEASSSAYIVSTIRDLMREYNIKAAPLFMTVSGQAVFPRYVKLPPVTRDKVFQIIQYEAEQNVPFPIDEVVWDYQLIGADEGGELHVMLVAVKTENITELTDCVQAIGLEPEIVDVAPMALYNAVRYNYPDIEGCTMILDMGARSSNLIFIEENRIFNRSIPIAGNAITQELVKEFDISFSEAEKLKLDHSFVAFGGVYAGPDSEMDDRVSKIVRNVITRLHAEVNRSINFYRSQQNGTVPLLVLLTGGTSIIPHTDTFFREKLKVQVEYLNPFVNLAVSQAIDADRVSGDLHLLGEVAGLALRRVLSCPIEINLMPPDIVAKKIFRKRQPFFALAAVGLILVLLCWWMYFLRMRVMLRTRMQKVEWRSTGLRRVSANLGVVKEEKYKVQKKVDDIMDAIALRTQWIEMLDAIHSCMLDGMWLKSLRPVIKDDAITYIEISGSGFVDKMIDKPEATAIEEFRNRLRGSEHFTDETRITKEPVVRPQDFDREFEILAVLKKPINIRSRSSTG